MLSKALAVMMSGMPSPVRSATATENGCLPVAKVICGAKFTWLLLRPGSGARSPCRWPSWRR